MTSLFDALWGLDFFQYLFFVILISGGVVTWAAILYSIIVSTYKAAEKSLAEAIVRAKQTKEPQK